MADVKLSTERNGFVMQSQLTALDAQYQAKIMGEVERYQGLVKERDQLNTRWDEQNNLLVQSHERVIQDLTEEYDQKLQEEQVRDCNNVTTANWCHCRCDC